MLSCHSLINIAKTWLHGKASTTTP
jgi:hypothetical protein